MFGKINQKGITWKIRYGEQSFLCATRRPDLIDIPIKLHEIFRIATELRSEHVKFILLACLF